MFQILKRIGNGWNFKTKRLTPKFVQLMHLHNWVLIVSLLMLMELSHSSGSMLMKKYTDMISFCLEKCGSQNPALMFRVRWKLTVWRELCLLFRKSKERPVEPSHKKNRTNFLQTCTQSLMTSGKRGSKISQCSSAKESRASTVSKPH